MSADVEQRGPEEPGGAETAGLDMGGMELAVEDLAGSAPDAPDDIASEPSGIQFGLEQLPKIALIGTIGSALVASQFLSHSGGPNTVGAAIFVAVLSLGFLIFARPTNWASSAALVAAVACSPLVAVRASPWVVIPAVLIIVASMLSAPIMAFASGPVFTLSAWMMGLLKTFLMMIVSIGFVPAIINRFRAIGRTARDRTRLRAFLIASPVIVVLVILLRASDPIMQRWLRLPTIDSETIESWIGGVFLGLFVAVTAIAAAVNPVDSNRLSVRVLRRSDITTVLSAVVVVLTVFGTVQLMAVIGGPELVRTQAGVSWSSYSRSGYFPLLWAAALILLTLGLTRHLADGVSTRAQRVLALATVGLTLGLIASAVIRLRLYLDAYGPTMLRVACVVFALWLAVVFGLTAMWWCGWRSDRVWLTPAIALCGLVVFVVWGAANPEYRVARSLIEHRQPGVPLDVRYLAGLSADGRTAAMEAVLESQAIRPASPNGALLSGEERAALHGAVVAGLCFEITDAAGKPDWYREEFPADPMLESNRSAERERDLLSQLPCRSSSPDREAAGSG